MAAIMKSFCLVLFLGLVSNANGRKSHINTFVEGNAGGCKPNDLTIHQKQTGKVVNEKPEWAVEVANACACTQLDITLSCTGFKTVEKVDPEVITVTGNLCSINLPVFPNSSINFTYASDGQFPFKVAQSTEACS